MCDLSEIEHFVVKWHYPFLFYGYSRMKSWAELQLSDGVVVLPVQGPGYSSQNAGWGSMEVIILTTRLELIFGKFCSE